MATRRPEETHAGEAGRPAAAGEPAATEPAQIPVRRISGGANVAWIIGAILLVVIAVFLIMGLL